GSHPPPAPARTGRGNPLPAAAQSITGTGRSRRPPRHGRMDPAPPPQGRSRHAISGHHRRHAPGSGAELHEGYGNRTGRNRLPARLLLTGSISTRVQTLDRRSTRAISPADETAKAGLKRVPSRAPIRTRHGCSYNQYPALGFNARNGIWRTCRSTAHGANRNQTKPQSQPHSHPTRVLLQSISGVEVQYPGKGSGLTCRSTSHGPNRNRTKPQSQPHSHPTRVLLQSISGLDAQYP